MIYLIEDLNGFYNDIGGVRAEKTLLQLLPLLSDARLEKVMSYHFNADRLNSAAVFVLLRYALLKEYQSDEMPVLNYDSTGKPYLQNRKDIYFNLSHSKGTAACIVSDAETGIDIQEHFSFDQGIVDYICSDKEKALFEQVRDKDRLLNRLWVLKEAYNKYLGTGIIVDLREIDFSGVIFQDDCKFEKTPPEIRQCFMKIVEKETYCMAACTHQAEIGPVLVTVDQMTESLMAME